MKKTKRVMIIGDSLAMPRPGVSYEDTWVYKLIKAFPDIDFVVKTRRASTSERLGAEGGGDGNPRGADLLEYYMPDTVIMQLGVVDCAPRYFKQGGLENLILNRIFPERLRLRYIQWVKRTRTRDPHKAHVSLERFRRGLADYFQRAQAINAQVIALLITPVSDQVSNESPFIRSSIEKYNEVYRSLSKEYENVFLLQPLDDAIELDDITSDGYHINKEGHRIVCTKIMKHQCLA